MRTSGRQLWSGAARREITPAIGTPLSGFIARLGAATGVAHRLFARSLILRDEQVTLVVVEFDLLALAGWHIDEIRRRCRLNFSIPPENVLISTTHTHSGPGMVPLRGCTVANLAYQWKVINRAWEAISEAHARLSPAQIRVNRIPFRLGVNRRQRTPSGVVLGIDRKKPCPRMLDVLEIKTKDGKLCVLFSHTAHPYILGGDLNLISGDFPSAACEFLEKTEGIVAIFLNGCAGDIAPLRAFEGLDALREEGIRLGSAVLSALKGAKQLPGFPLAAMSKQVHLPHRKLPTLAELTAMRREPERTVRPRERINPAIRAKLRSALEHWSGSLVAVIEGWTSLEPIFAEVQVIRAGDFCLVGIAGEPFFSLGQRISRFSRFRYTWTLGYCNEYCGYLPTAKAFSEGGYEVSDSYRYLGIWQLEPSCGSRVVQTARQLLEEMPER